MKQTILLMFIASVMSIGAYADDSSDAKKVLDKIATVVSNQNGVEADFTLTGERMNVRGTIAVKGGMFTAKSADATVWFDGTTQWTYMKRTDEVNITTPTKDQQVQMNPLTFINLYKSGYKLSTISKTKTKEIRMQAESSSNAIQEVYVTYDPSTYIPIQVRMRRKSTWMTINISNFKTLSQGDDIFVFNKKDFPTAEIVDLR